jgi:uncharacterized alpha-E superfamily protein
MLSRTAAGLYWMSRYLERAENLARMLEVSYSLSLMPEDGRSDGLHELAMPLQITGNFEAYEQRHGGLNAEHLLHFFALDPHNPASLYNCLACARTNAHAVRGRITADMWEIVNSSWLEIREIAAQGLGSYGISRFCDWVKARSQLFRGATLSTIIRGDAFHFICLGIYIERADNTLRLLDGRYELLDENAAPSDDTSAHAYYQWSAMLHALSSFEAFAAVYRGSPRAGKVAELLLLREDVPRALRACLDQIADILADLPGDNGRPAQRLAAQMAAELRYTSIDEVLKPGLHESITVYIEQLQALGTAIHSAYLEAA